MKRYPFEFILADALEYCREHGREFDAIHASPPCQAYSEATPVWARGNHPDLIAETRATMSATGKPYIIENVENARAKLIDPIMLCGTMLGLPIWRHRYFEMWPRPGLLTPPCCHIRRPITIHSGSHTRKTWLPVLASGGGDGKNAKGRNLIRPRERVDVIRWAMGIDWMTQAELTEAIPPAYTEWIGRRLIEHLQEHEP
jgi:DNA (cytosine-5)-methyltransferase 1